MTFVLSIETDAGTYMHGFHLGTDEHVARYCAEEAQRELHPRIGTYIRTVALIRDGKVFDVFDGQWMSDYLNSGE